MTEKPSETTTQKCKCANMAKTTEESNKALILEAFDTFFNKRARRPRRYWSSNYIQHSAHIPPGRDGLFKPRIGDAAWACEIEQGEDNIDAEFQSEESESEFLPAHFDRDMIGVAKVIARGAAFDDLNTDRAVIKT